MNEYEARLERRRERYLALAEKADAASDAAYKRSHELVEHIPMGQPILVGHHSERAHRNALNKSWDALGRSVHYSEKAKYYRQKAAAVGSAGISAQDPNARSKIQAKIAELENQREMMKSANRAYKLAVKKGINEVPEGELNIKDLEEIGEKVNLPVGNFLIKAVSYKPEYSFDKGPFVGWPLSNLGANIRRYKARLEDLEREAESEGLLEKEYGEVKLLEDDGRVQVIFPSKPSAEVRSRLKSNGFKWSPSRKAWVRMANNRGRFVAESMMNVMEAEGLLQYCH